MTEPGEAGIRQLPTHTQLVGSAEALKPAAWPRSALDAIVVPASRPAESLMTVAAKAKGIGCHLVVLCSLLTDPHDVRKLFDAYHLPVATVVPIPAEYDHPLFDFRTTQWSRQGDGKGICAVRSSDLSIKRNVGLLLARMLGWNRIFFMDDDIREISANAVLDTVSLIGTNGPSGDRYRSAAMMVRDFPDNSVVCHARRVINEYQDVFVSGSVLAVDIRAPFDFFPDIYNEDWLFFYRDAAAQRLASSGFRAKQLPYDPFAEPQRAAGQEFGDVIAEGLYALLHRGQGSEYADQEYWRAFIDDRKRILEQIKRSSYKAASSVRQEMVKAVGSAREKLREIEPEMCVRYTEEWRADLEVWARRLETLPNPGSIQKAIQEVELSPI